MYVFSATERESVIMDLNVEGIPEFYTQARSKYRTHITLVGVEGVDTKSLEIAEAL